MDVALGDLDGDGDLDAYLTFINGAANEIWLNDGTGTFSDSGQSLGGSNDWFVALGDLDGSSAANASATIGVSVNPASTSPSSFGTVLQGIDAYDRSGWSVSAAGDVNGDGTDDLIIGTFGANPNGVDSAGESYVVYGGQALLDDFDLADGSQDGVIHLAFIEDVPFV